MATWSRRQTTSRACRVTRKKRVTSRKRAGLWSRKDAPGDGNRGGRPLLTSAPRLASESSPLPPEGRRLPFRSSRLAGPRDAFRGFAYAVKEECAGRRVGVMRLVQSGKGCRRHSHSGRSGSLGPHRWHGPDCRYRGERRSAHERRAECCSYRKARTACAGWWTTAQPRATAMRQARGRRLRRDSTSVSWSRSA